MGCYHFHLTKLSRGHGQSAIHLPDHAPERFKDRETLWNELEWEESNKKAQLTHSFDVAFMNEFSMEENIKLARRFVREQLVNRGMIVDLAIHDPKRSDGKNQNCLKCSRK